MDFQGYAGKGIVPLTYPKSSTMTFRKITFTLIFALGAGSLMSQKAMTNSETIPVLSAKDSVVSKSWIFQVGFNFVDDSGDAFNDFTTIRDQWNAVPYPSMISIGRYFPSGLGLELIGTYNRYKEGNTIDGVTITEDIPYYAVDTRLSYDLNKLFGETGFFDPYLGVGLGYTDANEIGRGTYNAVVGFRIWFNEAWGIDLNSSGKWSFGNEASNHIQHAAGIAYRFGIEKELSKKGMKKAALLTEMEAAMKRRQDSLLAAKEAEERQSRLAEEQAAAERLAAEREAERKREAEIRRQNDLRKALEDIGPVRFTFNSSFLSRASKEVLQQVAAFVQSNDSLVLAVHGHADSRGPSEYNQWLSERRAQRAMDYLISQGVGEDRLQVEGHGESQLLNGCSDGVSCSANEHAVNRRSVLEIISFGTGQSLSDSDLKSAKMH